VIVIGLSLWIAISQQQSLFSLMVTIFALFLAPTMLPILAGLTVRWVTWKGALTGFIAGLASGAIALILKTWYLPALPGMQGEWASYRFEGFSIFTNIAVTAIGLWLGSVIPEADREEQARIALFFRDLDTPIAPSEVKASSEDSARPALGAATIIVGCLLALAGLVANSPQARWIDLSFGLGLAIFGLTFLRRNRTPRRSFSHTV
jgi:hypothetical protein